MPKFRHIAIVCEDPAKLGEWYAKAFGFELIHRSPDNGVTVLSDGDFNLTLLHPAWVENNTPHTWHFGIEMTMEEIAARRPHLEALGASYGDGVRDGRSVEAFIQDPEGHRIDLAPYWPTKGGATHRQDDYQQWDGKEHAAVEEFPNELEIAPLAQEAVPASRG
jgi:catechol 2,3-dioxygenase-like lactoylglutathione lyase family enzyme